MDPLTAISFGANILQFVDFTVKLVSAGNEIHNSIHGATVENLDLESVTRTLAALHQKILDSNPGSDRGISSHAVSSEEDPDIKELGSGCNAIATEILEALDKLKAHNSGKRWTSIVQALKTIWAKSRIDLLRSRLEQYRATIQTALLVCLNNKLDLVTKQQVQHLQSGSEIDKLKADILEAIRQNSSHGSIVTTISNSLSNMNAHEKNAYFHKHMLEELSFQDQYDREQRIAEAHEKTFRWIFKRPEEQDDEPWSNFVSWLEKDNEHLYWITGKAGSGKSTLMKFLTYEKECDESLKVWATGLPLIITRFYFWNSGSKDQVSQAGLLRSILYDALIQMPELALKLFPRRWMRCELFGSDFRSWTFSELITAFNMLVMRSNESYKLCLFVDGLDEFEGDAEELISLFKRAISFPNVKACLSSRPWLVFEEAFLQRPSLMLEQLTYSDIMGYITTQFDSNSGFRALNRREPDFASTLISNIATKACGVFLWVNLVVRSLLSGMSNHDRICDLQRRLDELPSDLEDFYQKIFDSIDPFYAQHACQLFRLVDAAKGRLTVLGLSFADEEVEVSMKQALESPHKPMSLEEEQDRYESVRRRLNSRCKGFLEAPPAPGSESNSGYDRRHSNDMRRHKVAYLHRTVKDFLETKEISSRIDAQAGDFEPCLPLLNSSVLLIKTWYIHDFGLNAVSQDDIGEPLSDTFKYAAMAEKLGCLNVNLLDEVCACMNDIDGTGEKIVSVNVQPRRGFLEQAASHSLSSYVVPKILSGSRVFQDEEDNPLLYRIITDYRKYPGLCQPEVSSALLPVPNLTIIVHLLQNGANPNHAVGEKSIFEHMLGECITVSGTTETWTGRDAKQLQNSLLMHWALIVEAFLKSNADPRVDRNSQQGSCIREAFGRRLEPEAAKLEKLLSRNRKTWSVSRKFLPPVLKKSKPEKADMTPITVLNRLNSVAMPVASLHQVYRPQESKRGLEAPTKKAYTYAGQDYYLPNHPGS